MDEITTIGTRPILTKADWRDRRRKLSFAQKILLLEKMRRCDALIARVGSRKTHQPNAEPAQTRSC
jgi:hypothetical protein